MGDKMLLAFSVLEVNSVKKTIKLIKFDNHDSVFVNIDDVPIEHKEKKKLLSWIIKNNYEFRSNCIKKEVLDLFLQK